MLGKTHSDRIEEMIYDLWRPVYKKDNRFPITNDLDDMIFNVIDDMVFNVIDDSIIGPIENITDIVFYSLEYKNLQRRKKR